MYVWGMYVMYEAVPVFQYSMYSARDRRNVASRGGAKWGERAKQSKKKTKIFG